VLLVSAMAARGVETTHSSRAAVVRSMIRAVATVLLVFLVLFVLLLVFPEYIVSTGS
jgi:VIT1/CCC1 family predicted Fe2+/Mn2+ transporter